MPGGSNLGSGSSGGILNSSCSAPGGGAALAATASSFNVTSNPAGLAVTLTVNGTTRNVGSTPVTVTLSANSSSLQTITVDPSGSCYQVQATYNGTSGTQQLFFNKAAYTAAQINTSSIQAALRATSSSTTSLPARGPVRLAGAPGVDQSRIYVHYSLAALRAAGRSAQSIASSVGARTTLHIATNGDDELQAVAVPAGRSIDAFADAMRAQTGVRGVDAVHLRRLVTTIPTNPNDCHFGAANSSCSSLIGQRQQWDLTQIGAPNAWSYFSSPFATKPVKIAIIDTGFDCNAPANVNDLAQNVVFSESIVDGVVSTVGSPNSPGCAALDTDGHGTNVAGIADAMTNNQLGFAGVAANAQLYIYRIFPAGVNQSASTADEAAAINDAVSKGVNVINLSLGSPASQGPDAGEQAAIQNALNNNIVVVAAAGNDATSSVDYPAAYSGVISVGATALADGQLNGRGNTYGSQTAPVEYIASYSNYGPNLTLVAPGGDPAPSECSTGGECDDLHWITNLYSTGDTTPGDQCSPASQPDQICAARFAGTSQATPHVSGAAALIIARNQSYANPTAMARLLQGTADDICGAASFACPAGTIMEGSGRLDVYRALAVAAGDPNPPAYRPAVNQFIAFAYTNTVSVGTKPQILDTNFPNGIPVGGSGAFQLGDLPVTVTSYKIGVWYNAAGNGVVSPGDSFGFVTCSGQSPCSAAANITVGRVQAGQTF
jgi:subtilisin family serine protease